MQFTDKFIQNLKPTDKKVYVRETRGFCLRIMPSGVKTFLYLYTINGKRQELNLGNYPYVKLTDAREAYNDAYKLVNKGIDPKEYNKAIEEAKERARYTTFEHFSTEYMKHSKEHHALAWHKTLDLSLKNDVLPAWQDRDITEIKRRDVIALLETVAKRSPGQAANVHKAVRGVFDYALQREHIEFNPAIGLSKAVPALKGNSRDRILTDQEIKTIWHTLDDSPISKALKLILVTAQRPGEVAGMHINEIEVGVNKPLCATCRGCGLWTIPQERAEKGKGDHLVYLTPTALELMRELQECSDGLIFDVKRNSLSQVVSRSKYYNLPRWTPHDLRRTARTLMARIGVIDEHAEAVLAHSKPGIKKVYNRYEYQEEKKAALLKWEAELLRIVQ